MTAFSVQTPYPPFADADGAPLENGYIWLGSAGLDPQSNPVTAYFDAALTITAAQPIRTQGGYPVYQGTPARLYINGTNYSIRVMNRSGLTVYTALNTTEAWNGSVLADNSVTTAKLAPNAVTAAKVERVAANQVLRSTGVSSDPAWGALDLTTDVTDVLPAANGGTGVSVFPAPGALGNVLYSDGTDWTAAPVALGQNVEVKGSGSGFFTIPAGVTRLKATVVGGGGGSSGALSGGTGRGGGGGGTAIKWLSGLTPGNTIAYSVGAGGTAGTSTGNGGNGSASTISSGTQTITTVTGGAGAGGDLSGGAGGNGGAATNGDLNISGTNGNNASSGSSLFSSPIVSTLTPNFVIIATAGNGYGGGAAAAASVSSNTAGAAGAAGVVIFEW